MNKTVIKELMYLLFFALCFDGCKKDTAVLHDAPGPKLMFVKARANGGDIIQSESIYNEDGNIKTRISYKDYATGLIGSKTKYTYQDGRMVQKEEQVDISGSTFASQYFNSRSVFEYSGDHIIQQNHYLNINNHYELRSFTVFTYDNAGHPVKQTRYSADGALLGYTLYTYEGNNVAVSEEYNQRQSDPEPVLILKHSYKHDKRKNPYGNVYHKIENIPFSVNENNITETVTVSHNAYSSSPGQPGTTSLATYVYNNSGYPVLMNENGNTFILEYK